MQAAIWLKQKYPKVVPKVFLFPDAFSFDFYANGQVAYYWSRADLEKVQEKKGIVMYVSQAELAWLKEKYRINVLKEFEYFHITRLKPKFLNSKTRSTVLNTFYLVKFN